MKQFMKELVLSLLIGLVIPAMLLSISLNRMDAAEEHTAQPSLSDDKRTALKMRLRASDGSVHEMDMDEYLVGVLLAEMPASFSQEAKCAQAIVARTYTQKAFVSGGKHTDGSVCGDSSCCQAYYEPQTYLADGGTQQALDDARAAVSKTSGYVLTYEGELIEATYFSCSGGRTEDAVAVWGTDFPYLRATDSPGEENALHDMDTVTFTAEEFAACLGRTLSADAQQWFSDITYTDGGGVETMRICGEIYKGTQLRSLLSLRSTAFSVSVKENKIEITTKGFGHRVGMSQYGAEAMASQGCGYAEILSHYYAGTELTFLD